jgi:DNA polymerase-3 subunit delta'
MPPSGAFAQLIGQRETAAVLREAARSAAGLGADEGRAPGTRMTHAWLFTGPPGSGRTVAALAFAAALECTAAADPPGCGQCRGCQTALAGTHADVHVTDPEGLSIKVEEMRELIQTASRMPSTGAWQVVIIADADRLTERASAALLKSVEEPPERTVFLLCTPSDHPEDVSVTIRSRCRVLPLGAPAAEDVAEVLRERDGIDAETAAWAASVCGGHVGRARRLATDPAARDRREAVLGVPVGLRSMADVFRLGGQLVEAAESDARTVSEARDEPEREAVRTAMGAGGTGKGTAAAGRAASAAVKQLERAQRSRARRTERDTYDLALVDLAGFYRDVLAELAGGGVRPIHPDRATDVAAVARSSSPEQALASLDAVLAARDAIGANVKPRIAIEAMLTTLGGY